MFFKTNISSRAWGAWFTATFFYAFQYVLRVSPSVMMEDIRQKFSIDAGDFGQFSGFYYLGYALMHLPCGVLLDRFGPRWVMTLSVLLCSLGLVPLIVGDSWMGAVIGRFILGAGSSGAILGLFKVIRLQFPAEKFATVLGFSVMVGILGAIYGGLPVQALVTKLGWEHVTLLFCGSGIFLAGIMATLIPNNFSIQPKLSVSSTSIKKELSILFKTPYLFSTAALGGLMVGPLEGFADVWARPFLRDVYGFSKEVAAGLPSLIFLGMSLGSPLIAYVGEKTKNCYWILRLCALSMIACFGLLLFCSLSLEVINLLFVFLGVLSAYQVIIVSRNSMRVPARYSGVVTSCTNMILMSFGYIFHFLIGKGMDLYGGQNCVNNIIVYPKEAYALSLLAIPLGLFLAFGGSYMEEWHSKFKKLKY